MNSFLLKLFAILFLLNSMQYALADELKIRNLAVFEYVKIGDSEDTIDFVEQDGCVGVAIYFALAKNNIAIPYHEIVSKLKSDFGDKPYSMLTLDAFLEKQGFTIKPIQLQNPPDIFKSDFDEFILYMSGDPVGHFSYVKKNKKSQFVVYDPILGDGNVVSLTEEFLKEENWKGVLMLIKHKEKSINASCNND